MIMTIGPAIRSVIVPASSVASDGWAQSLDAQFAAFMAALTGPRVLFDVSRASSRLQDVAGSTLVTADGQPIGRLNDASGAGNDIAQPVAASMPLYRTDGVLHWAEFDGSNDSWKSLANLDMSATNKVTVIAGVRKLSDANGGAPVVEFSANYSANAGTFALFAPVSVTPSIGFLAGGTTRVVAQATSGYAAPVSLVLSGISDIAAPLVRIRANGAAVIGSASSQGTGNLGAYPLFIGRRNDASLPFNGRLYGLLIIGRLLTTDELSLCERWMASKTGVAL